MSSATYTLTCNNTAHWAQSAVKSICSGYFKFLTARQPLVTWKSKEPATHSGQSSATATQANVPSSVSTARIRALRNNATQTAGLRGGRVVFCSLALTLCILYERGDRASGWLSALEGQTQAADTRAVVLTRCNPVCSAIVPRQRCGSCDLVAAVSAATMVAVRRALAQHHASFLEVVAHGGAVADPWQALSL